MQNVATSSDNGIYCALGISIVTAFIGCLSWFQWISRVKNNGVCSFIVVDMSVQDKVHFVLIKQGLICLCERFASFASARIASIGRRKERLVEFDYYPFYVRVIVYRL